MDERIEGERVNEKDQQGENCNAKIDFVRDEEEARQIELKSATEC